MKIKPKGRKIYRYKTRFERLKGFLHDSRAVTLTILGTGVLVFVGYSIGAPVMDFLKKQEILIPASVVESNTSSISETTAPTEEPTQPPIKEHQKICGYYLEKSALSTMLTLEKALQEIPEGITHVIIPLKAEGGRLYYGTRLADAGMCGAVIAATPLETIYSTIAEKGFIPVASINTLEDSVYPQTYAESAYKIMGSTDKWLDDAPENGGKPRLSPFSELTLDYLSNLTDEIVHAGFTVILCEGLTFPDFTEEELKKLDPEVSASDRALALADVVNVMQDAAGDAAFYVSVEGDALLTGEVELFDAADLFTVTGVVVSVNTQSALQKQNIQNLLSDYSCVLQLEGEVDVKTAAINGSYVLRP